MIAITADKTVLAAFASAWNRTEKSVAIAITKFFK